MAYIDKEHGYFTPAQSDLNWAQTFRMTGRAPGIANRIFDTLQHMQDYINDFSQIVNFIKKNAISNDIILTQGAGTVTNIGLTCVK